MPPLCRTSSADTSPRATIARRWPPCARSTLATCLRSRPSSGVRELGCRRRHPGRSGEGVADWPDFEALTGRKLSGKLKQALEDSDQGIVDDSRSTLPGYQPKVLFDEHYSHLLAQHVGLSSYRSEIRKAGRMTCLAIERFDRELVGGQVRLHHQEDLAQALGLNSTDTNVKFQAPEWPTDKRRASARRIGELLGSIPSSDAALAQWLRQLTFHIAVGNNDAHAKNVALMHLQTGTELSQLYDAVPNLFQEGLIKFDLALALGGIFDHRRMSVERLVAEAVSWGVIASSRTETIIGETLSVLADALNAVKAPRQISESLGERLQWNVKRLLAGDEISETRRDF